MMSAIRTMRQMLTAVYGYLFLAVAVYVLQSGFSYLHKNINKDVIAYGIEFVKPIARTQGTDITKLKENLAYFDSFLLAIQTGEKGKESPFADDNPIAYFNSITSKLEKSLKTNFEGLESQEDKAALKAKIAESFKQSGIESKFENLVIHKNDDKETINNKVEVVRRLVAL